MLKLSFFVALIGLNIILSNQQQCSNYYVVKSGDTCWAIWTGFGISEAAFYSYNYNLNCNGLHIGQILCLSPPNFQTAPPTTAPPSIGTCTYAYMVQPGDYCYTIITKYNIDALTFLNLNPNINCNNLIAGSIVCLASFSVTAAPSTTNSPIVMTNPPYISRCYRTYTVKAGDTCWYIANSFTNLGDSKFYTANPGINCNNLQIGQVVCLDDCSSNKNYCIIAGDTCYGIWTKFGITDTTFYNLNPGINCNFLKPGDIINVGKGYC